MSTVNALQHFWQVYGPGITACILALLPSVITGLSPTHPKWGGFLTAILRVFQSLSGVKPKDSPGTLQVPLYTAISTGFYKNGVPPVSLANSNAIKALLVLVALHGLSACAALSAAAGTPQVSTGPSLDFMEIRPGYANPVQVSAGVGWQLSVCLFPVVIDGQEADMGCASGAIYGSAVSAPAASYSAALGASASVGTWNNVVTVGIGEDVISTTGTAFGLPPYAVVHFNPLQLMGKPPPSGAAGVNPPRRWFTVYTSKGD